jgi:hypothetical protein
VAKVRSEVSVPVTPSVFIIELHRCIEAARPPFPIDVTRLGTVVEICLTEGGHDTDTKVWLHMAANSAGTVVSLEAPSDGYSMDLIAIVESLMRKTEDAIKATAASKGRR